MSKREQRKRQKEKAKKSNLKISTKKRDGINIRRKGRYELKKKIEILNLKLQKTQNNNRRMKRKIERMKSMLPTTEEVTEHSIYVDNSSSETSVSSAILGNVSPSSRKRAVKRLKLNPSLYESVNWYRNS